MKLAQIKQKHNIVYFQSHVASEDCQHSMLDNTLLLDWRDYDLAYLYYSFEGVKSHEDCPTHVVVVPCFLPRHKSLFNELVVIYTFIIKYWTNDYTKT